ncbi:NAD(P)H-dependent oxidoreductase [Viridibacillus sp. YIM B01967]|uniref:NAD(P)H-dependent oxidoreductase n=1 Tax=Viridibacillus soli TaxID=2798301 RepID=A0ABS1HDE2_9BACL|nr:NAD(P)H-dependent oxidoreductase [Viridibacillus soli]MBK3497425.1 NAD(P)H-dependent oxidoreductase [Viridibacillus soli]
MDKILLVDGHDQYERAQGTLTQSLAKVIQSDLSTEYEIQTTIVKEGYEVDKEIEKFLWADCIVIQTPIYWFSIPGLLKKYFDDIFLPKVFFAKGPELGRGGLLKEKKYMFSVTWGVKKTSFASTEPTAFLEGKTEDEVLFPVHKTFEYCGMQQLPTFSLYGAMKERVIEEDLNQIQAHLKKIFIK